MREVYGTQRRVHVEGDILFQSFNNCAESDDDKVIAKIRGLFSAACFDNFDVKIVERIENTRLVMDANTSTMFNQLTEQYPGAQIGEKIKKPTRVKAAESTTS